MDYVNVREHNVYPSGSGSSYVGSAVAAAMVDSNDWKFNFTEHLLRFQSAKEIETVNSAAEVVRVKLEELADMPEDTQEYDTVTNVIKLLQCATDALQGISHSFEWKREVEMPRNVVGQSEENKFDNYMMSRVYWPRISIFDLMLPKSDVDQIIGPLAQIKQNSELSQKLQQYTLQDGLFGIGFIQRVFPMLPSHDVSCIFGEEWYVYVPLMSHKSLYIVRIDLCDIYGTGKIIIARSGRLQGVQMANRLTSWVKWAIRVYEQLQTRANLQGGSPVLNAPVAQYCWIAPHLLCRIFPNLDHSKLVARPSFYNPIYIDQDQGHVYKLYSFWTANLCPVENEIRKDPFLCDGWYLRGTVLKNASLRTGRLETESAS
ncbi:hypothetical protein MIR68_012543 [Amoeboaphelidium protococcarum]|nr:hypothetical protein MIR68_012543 [Amoeboaphelidium protococcarum]